MRPYSPLKSPFPSGIAVVACSLHFPPLQAAFSIFLVIDPGLANPSLFHFTGFSLERVPVRDEKMMFFAFSILKNDPPFPPALPLFYFPESLPCCQSILAAIPRLLPPSILSSRKNFFTLTLAFDPTALDDKFSHHNPPPHSEFHSFISDLDLTVHTQTRPRFFSGIASLPFPFDPLRPLSIFDI